MTQQQRPHHLPVSKLPDLVAIWFSKTTRRTFKAEPEKKRDEMGMDDSGGGGGLNASINVTPMIDVLLVLLIVFMVITPVTPKGLDALVPQPPKNPQKQQDNDRTIVVQITHRPGGGVPGLQDQ